MRIRVASVLFDLVTPVVLGSGALLFAIAGSGGATVATVTVGDEIAAKQQRLQSVVAELALRDVADLPAERREARARAIALLKEYGERGRFTVHHELWPREQPLFIDEHGTRCALASVLDGFGEDATVLRLAAACNDAYVAEIADDAELARCLDELGLTLDEAAYIQDPGTHDHGGGFGFEQQLDAEQRLADAQRLVERMGNAARPKPTGTGSVAKGGDVGATPTTTGRTAPSGAALGSRRERTNSSLTWVGWWLANRDAFVDLRQRYHGGSVRSGAASPQVDRPLRPSEPELRALVPFFLEVAQTDRDVRSTAIAMAARAADASAAPAVIDAALAYLADPHQPEREWGPVMLAILGDPAACAPLAELVRDSEAGRALLTQTAAVPEPLRALAAVAYGRCGGDVDLLLQTLADAPAAHQDVAASCVVGLGLAARDLSQRPAAMSFLLAQLEEPTLPDAAVAQVPAALVLARDPAALPGLFAVVAKFRGPRELRRASALALAQLAPELDEPLCDALAALARRDVDADCRHAAIVALGTLAARHGAIVEPAVLAKLVALHEDGLAGALRQDEDLPWHALSAGLFLRGRPSENGAVRVALRELARGASDEALRAASCLALGLARDEGAAPQLLEAVDDGSDRVASCAAQALGLAGAREVRHRLLEHCRTHPSENVGYSAAFALGCLADPMVVDPLVATFEQTSSASVRAALSRAIGEIGDRRAIEALRGVALDRLRDLPSRERALGALGVLAQPADQAWNEEIKLAVEPGAATPSLRLLLELY